MSAGDELQRWASQCLSISGAGHLWKIQGWHERVLLAIVISLIGGFVAAKVAKLVSTLRAVALAPSLARSLSRLVRSLNYTEEEFPGADGAAERWIEIRKLAIERLAQFFQTRSAKSIAFGDQIRDGFSDLRFTDANRVPFPFMRVMREKFHLCSVVTESKGPRLRDLDGRWCLDVSGSYGLNVAGFDQYKEWIDKGWEKVRDLGPVLGPLHPLLAENIALLKSISKLDEVSFHMSGTEAVMAAVRLARFNTRKKLIVCFSGAYHGWWDGVQPGLGSERAIDDCLTLKDMSPASLDLIRLRAKEIAGVLINPIQSFHPNLPPPSDTVLLTSGVRKTQDSTSEYSRWLNSLREVCTACNVPLIFDEVFSGFRLAPGGAQEYFGVQADMVIYGKTVAGGMPIGLICGRKELMRRFDPDHPMRIAYVVGTFSAHPLVLGAMNEFLQWLVRPETPGLYEQAKNRCDQWVRSTNLKLAESSIPLRVMNIATVWTVLFKEPGRYNWLLQYYLRAEGVILSWVGTGRCMTSLDFTDTDYQDLQEKILDAGQKMKSDQWWLSEEQQPGRNKVMRQHLIREMARSIVQIPKPVQDFYTEIMLRKKHDHEASHSNLINQVLHLFSSSSFIICYILTFFNFTAGISIGVFALLLRQFGHAILEPPCHDKERALLGYNTRNKSLILALYALIPVVNLVTAGSLSFETIKTILPVAARQWFLLTLAVVFGRVAYLIWSHDLRSGVIWFVKLITDPITDVIAYYGSALRVFQPTQERRSEPA